MVFKREALKELRERLGMTRGDLAFALSETSKFLGLENSYTGVTIGNYESGRTLPRVDILDSLEALAKTRGCTNIVFYESFTLAKLEGREIEQWGI